MSKQIFSSSGFDCCLSWFAQLCLVSDMFDPWMEWIITAVTGFQMPCPDTRWVPVNPQDIGVIGAPVTMALVQHQKPSTSLLKQNNISFTFIFMARVLCIDSYNFHLRLTTSSTSHKLSSLQLSSCCFYLNYKHPEFSTSTFRCLTHLEADGRMKSISLHHLYQLQGTISGGIGLALPLQLRLKSAIIFSAVYMSSESTWQNQLLKNNTKKRWNNMLENKSKHQNLKTFFQNVWTFQSLIVFHGFSWKLIRRPLGLGRCADAFLPPPCCHARGIWSLPSTHPPERKMISQCLKVKRKNHNSSKLKKSH